MLDTGTVAAMMAEVRAGIRGMDGGADPNAVRLRVEAEKRRVISEQTARSGGVAPQLAAMYVDGVRGAALPTGGRSPEVVTLDWSYLREAVTVTLAYLREHGHFLSGDWRNSLRVMIGNDDVEVAEIPATATVATVVATVEYARWLEVRQGVKIKVGSHFMRRAATELARRHAALARFSHRFETINGAHKLQARNVKTNRRGRVSTDITQTHVTYPAIRIEERQL